MSYIKTNFQYFKEWGIIIPCAPNFGHQWFFTFEDYSAYSAYESTILLKCTSCNYEIVYIYGQKKYLTNVATANLFGLNKSFEGKIVKTCDEALNIKNMQDALE